MASLCIAIITFLAANTKTVHSGCTAPAKTGTHLDTGTHVQWQAHLDGPRPQPSAYRPAGCACISEDKIISTWRVYSQHSSTQAIPGWRFRRKGLSPTHVDVPDVEFVESSVVELSDAVPSLFFHRSNSSWIFWQPNFLAQFHAPMLSKTRVIWDFHKKAELEEVQTKQICENSSKMNVRDIKSWQRPPLYRMTTPSMIQEFSEHTFFVLWRRILYWEKKLSASAAAGPAANCYYCYCYRYYCAYCYYCLYFYANLAILLLHYCYYSYQ